MIPKLDVYLAYLFIQMNMGMVFFNIQGYGPLAQFCSGTVSSGRLQ